MIKQNQILKIRNILVALTLGVIVSTLVATYVNAEGRKRIYSMSAVKAKAFVTNDLTAKLRNDLFNPDVKFQFRNVEEYKVSNGKIIMKGDGFCVLTKSNTKMPLKFETVIDSNSNETSEIEYNFVDFKEHASDAPSANEEKLMNVLLSKLSKDFKTQDVVISIDDSKAISRSNAKKAYVGYGNVKVKNGKWKSVEFTVEMDLNNKTAKNVTYKLK